MENIRKEVLITGGTSGLGKSLTKQFLNNDYVVTVLGKSTQSETAGHPHLTAYQCDFSQLCEILKIVDMLGARDKPFDLLINNAGILSPPDYRETVDGFELSYQVNFLAHVLLTHLLLNRELLRPGLVINTTSQMYKKGKLNIKAALNKNHYSVLQAYANSKLYMALLSEKLANENISGFSFNPGTFSSEIYRMQKKWFHVVYKIAAPFMMTSEKVAEVLFSIIDENKWQDGWMLDRSGVKRQLNGVGNDEKDGFWDEVNKQIEPHLS